MRLSSLNRLPAQQMRFALNFRQPSDWPCLPSPLLKQALPSCLSVQLYQLACAEELFAKIARCPGPSINGALTPEQTAVPFGPRRVSSGAAADALAAAVQEPLEADEVSAVPAEAAQLDNLLSANIAEDQQTVLPAEAAQLEGATETGDVAEAAAGVSKL